MFFYISKILFFLLSPLTWIIVLISYSIFGKNKKWKKRTLVISLIILLVFSNQFLFDSAMRAWEGDVKRFSDIGHYDYAIVLGGMIFYDSDNGQIITLRTIDRLLKTLELYEKGKVDKIFISGGSGSVLYPEFREGKILKQLLVDIGVPSEDVLYESESRNTYENAYYTKKTLGDELNGKSILLVTSSFHLRRANGCFVRQGINADLFPTDRYAGPVRYDLDYLYIPNINTFANWVILFKEIIGYAVYDIVGYI